MAAVRDGKLTGFLIAELDLGGAIPEAGWPSAASLGGAKSASIRIGHHGADPADATAVYRAMFTAFAGQLVKRGCFRHSVTVALCDAEAVQAWIGLGFGVDQILGTRHTEPVANPRPDLTVRRAEPRDIEAVLTLNEELQRYHAGPPMFMPAYFEPEPVRRMLLLSLELPGKSIWLAEDGGTIGGIMEFDGGGRPSFNNARSHAGVTIGTAAVSASARGSGVGTAILSRGLDWAREQEYDHCTVGWTGPNPLSHRFWLGRGFRPIHYTLTRQLDERIATQLPTQG